MRKRIMCPRCRRETTWKGNPYRPFCSKWCKLIDLGSWIDGGYAIPGEKGNQPLENEELKARD